MSLWIGTVLDIPIRATLLLGNPLQPMRVLVFSWNELRVATHAVIDADWIVKRTDDAGDTIMRRFPAIDAHNRYRVRNDAGVLYARDDDEAVSGRKIVIRKDDDPIAILILALPPN